MIRSDVLWHLVRSTDSLLLSWQDSIQTMWGWVDHQRLIHAIVPSVHTTAMNAVLPQILWNATNPENGTIRWSTACQAAKDHGC